MGLQSGGGTIVLSRQPLKLFKEYKRENSVRSKAEVVRCEAFPKRENSLLTDHSQEYILETQ